MQKGELKENIYLRVLLETDFCMRMITLTTDLKGTLQSNKKCE